MSPPLKPWQPEGVQFLMKGRIRLLADDMGLGKSCQVVEAARRLGLKRMLLLCPKTPKHQWLREFDRFDPEHPPIKVMHGLRDELPDDGHVICTYEFARVRAPDLCIWGPWDCLVIDEFHELRGTKAKRTRAILHPTEGIVARVKRMWALTGTPIANHVGELYPLLKLAGIYPHDLRTFVQKFCSTYYDQTRGEIKITGVNPRSLPDLHALLDNSGIMLRRLKKDVMPELPPIVFEHVELKKGEVQLEAIFPAWELTGRMRELVERIEDQRAALGGILDGIETERLTFSEGVDMLAAQAGSISELRLLQGAQRIAGVVELIREELTLGLYPKIFLAPWHTIVIEGLAEGLKDFGVAKVYGGTTDKGRVNAIEKFTHDPECRVFIGQIKACGPAVNLTAKGKCHEVGLIEQSFVPSENSQAITRPHRIGAVREVRARLFTLDDPQDKRFNEIVFRKSIEIAKAMRENLFLSHEFDPIK